MSVYRLIVCFIFALFFSCNPSPKELPILSYKIDATGIKNYYKIDYEGFTNQLGELFEMKGHNIYIANFFFTSCPSICPPMRTEIMALAEEFSKEESVKFISHTIDPKQDSISVLKNYSDATGNPANKWQFLRATEEKTKLQAAKYMTNFKPKEDGTDFYHSSFVALVDQEQQLRGFYNVLVKEDVARLKTDIKRLLP